MVSRRTRATVLSLFYVTVQPLIRLHLTTSFAAVIIAASTRGRCRTRNIVIRFFGSTFSDGCSVPATTLETKTSLSSIVFDKPSLLDIRAWRSSRRRLCHALCPLSVHQTGSKRRFLMYIFPTSISPCYFPIGPLFGFLLRVQLSLPASVWMVKDKYTLTVNHDNHMRWWDETVVYCPDFSLSLSVLLLHGRDIALISQHSVICVTTTSSSFYVRRVRAHKQHTQWVRSGISTGLHCCTFIKVKSSLQ